MTAITTIATDSPILDEIPELPVSSRAATDGAGSVKTTLVDSSIVVITAKENHVKLDLNFVK